MKHFSKEDTQVANKHVKRCSPSLLAVKEMQTKTIMRYYFIPTVVAKTLKKWMKEMLMKM